MNREIQIKITVEQAAELMSRAVVNDALLKARGITMVINNNPLIKEIATKLMDEEFDVAMGMVKEVVEDNRLANWN